MTHKRLIDPNGESTTDLELPFKCRWPQHINGTKKGRYIPSDCIDIKIYIIMWWGRAIFLNSKHAPYRVLPRPPSKSTVFDLHFRICFGKLIRFCQVFGVEVKRRFQNFTVLFFRNFWWFDNFGKHPEQQQFVDLRRFLVLVFFWRLTSLPVLQLIPSGSLQPLAQT